MKASFESIQPSNHTSFISRYFEEESFSAPYHFHPEYELTLIIKGSGKRYTGTHMNDFAEGDLVLLGSNLPHCWKSNPVNDGSKSISIVIHFQKDFLGKDFFLAPEMKRILHLLNNSQYGIQFTGNTILIQHKMKDLLHEQDAFKKLFLMLDVLNELSASREYTLLEKQNTQTAFPFNEKERIHTAMGYIVDNFKNNISLKVVAALVNMTPEAFCKYFKKISRKTFIEVVNDYRIDFAIGQLINTEKSIVQIGFDSGFNDISNFYKTFKHRTKLSPLGYRKNFVSQVK